MMRLYSCISCISVKRKNKTQSHNSNCMTHLRKFVITGGFGVTPPERHGAEPRTPSQGHSCKETLQASKGVFKLSLKASKRQ